MPVERLKISRSAETSTKNNMNMTNKAGTDKAADDEKLNKLASVIWEMSFPKMATREGRDIILLISEQLRKTAVWIEGKAKTL